MEKVLKEFSNYKIDEYGVITNITTNHILRPTVKNGYYQIRLSKNGKSHWRTIHLLVYDTFKGKRTIGKQIDHIDGVRTNNHINNLREVTGDENNKNRKHLVRGSSVNTAKLTDDKVMEIRKRSYAGERTCDLAMEYEIAKSTVIRIISGKSWKHLPVFENNTVWKDPKVTGGMSGRELRKKYGDDYFSRIAKKEKVKKRCPCCGQIIK